jgi:hypothetical protein
MSTVATPYGLKPVGVIGNAQYSGGTSRAYRLTADNSIAIYANGPVTMAAGAINGIGASGTAGTPSVNLALGVCTGVQYTDPVMKYTLFAQNLPVNCITAGYTNVIVFVNDDPDALFQIQGAGQIAQSKIGWNAALTFASATVPGNATTGLSTVTLTAPANTDNLMMRVVDIVNQSSIAGGFQSTPNDAYTDVIVKWNFGAHIFHNHAVNV